MVSPLYVNLTYYIDIFHFTYKNPALLYSNKTPMAGQPQEILDLLSSIPFLIFTEKNGVTFLYADLFYLTL
jgi:hypothetical protein